ncbi:MAG: bifunctional [glutamate--ammonia ligase]-adenylyl-L-tyrosine phosphorylase/[glutamate--ammonia-ligase] adenylyltransferase [Acidobacteriota bacterium]
MKAEDLLLAPELEPGEVQEFLESYGFKDPAATDRNLQLMAEDLNQRFLLTRVVDGLLRAASDSPDPDAAINHFERLLANMTHAANFLGFLADTPEALEAAIAVCGSSPFAAEILIRNPEYFYWVLDQLDAPWIKTSEAYLKEARQAVAKFEDSVQKLHALARFKRREMLRISARDILRLSSVAATINELSSLADTIIQIVYEVCQERLVARFGVPQMRDASGKAIPARFAVLGMGKLGSQELNYSSDIDLIYCYDGERGATVAASELETGGSAAPGDISSRDQRGIPNSEFYKKLAQSITQELSNLTEEGYFYRVDLRLRPEGSAGSIAGSLSAYRNYYFTQGETFERLALIKARPAGGCRELGDEFCDSLKPFVYRKFLDFAALEEIQEIKDRIETKLSGRRRQAVDVKLSAGGIREIEFFVQAFQLIYGSRIPALQVRGTLPALDLLLKHKFVTSVEHRQLREAYLFLRDLEHKLQMVFHLQTHSLPENPDELYKCARRMGFRASTAAATIESFLTAFRSHSSNVSRIFQQLIGLRRESGAGHLREAALVLTSNLPEADAFALLSPVGFQDLKSAYHQITLLRDAPSFSHSPSKMRNLLANLIGPLLAELRGAADPDAGLSYFERFTTELGERNGLFLMLNESPEVLERLIRILSSSQFLAESICRKPEFLDLVNRTETLERGILLQEYRTVLTKILEESGSWELQLNALREFQKTELFRIALSDVLDQMPTMKVGSQLATLAEACLGAAFEMACQRMESEYGRGFVEGFREHFAILALGKFGGADFSYGSDLDLVFFYAADKTQDSAEVQLRAVRLVGLIDEILSISRGQGALYKIDPRLRPDGKKGELVVAVDKYQGYLSQRAEPWERLALIRRRFVMAGRRVGSRLRKMIDEFVFRPGLSLEVLQGLLHIRQRMELETGREREENCFHLKVGRGGLADVEFAAQLLQMKHGIQQSRLRVGGTLLALRRARNLDLLAEPHFRILHDGYVFLRQVENRVKLFRSGSSAKLPRTAESLERAARLLRKRGETLNAADLESRILATTASIRETFEMVSQQLGR